MFSLLRLYKAYIAIVYNTPVPYFEVEFKSSKIHFGSLCHSDYQTLV